MKPVIRLGWMVRVRGKLVGPLHKRSVMALHWALSGGVKARTPFDYIRVTARIAPVGGKDA